MGCAESSLPLDPTCAAISQRQQVRRSRQELRHQLDGQQPVRIDGTREGDLAARNAPEAKPGVVGLVTHQHDEGNAGGTCVLRAPRDNESATVALVGERGIDGERTQQQGAGLAADCDGREAQGGCELAVDAADAAEGRELGCALAHTVSGAGKTAGSEGARVQGADVGAVPGTGRADHDFAGIAHHSSLLGAPPSTSAMRRRVPPVVPSGSEVAAKKRCSRISALGGGTLS